ncbi:GAP family protein [Vibrio amylolyticus]|uniref:GAP family protein n=1 Tax=Vibrio amylolyticus TaxID=2847292 RepID=UPI00355179A9
MLELLPFLTPILLADILNPVLFAFLVYSVSTNKPIFNSIAVLLGHTLAYFFAGIAIAYGLDSLAERISNPETLDYIISLIIGCLLIFTVFKGGKSKAKEEKQEDNNLSVAKAFSLGAIINFVGIPFALPYFAAIDRILSADLNFSESLWTLAGYNLVYALPFTVVPILVALTGERSKATLERINHLLVKGSSFLMPVLLTVIGVALVADALMYFTLGKGLL